MLRPPRFSRADESTQSPSTHSSPAARLLFFFTTPRLSTLPVILGIRQAQIFKITMSLWREACQQLRHAVPKVAAGDRICMAQSRRHLSSSASRRGFQVARAGISSMNIRRPARTLREMRNRGQIQGFAQPRQQFSATAGVAHGHITPPKPGEE